MADNRASKRFLRHLLSVVASVGIVAFAVGTAGATTGGSGLTKVTRGGVLTVIGSSLAWPNLDPALDAQDAADSNILNAIYGQLLEAGPNGTYVPDIALGYSFSDHNLQITLPIRKGVEFSDGTPLNAAAVAASITRVLSPAFSCICDANFKDVTSITSTANAVQLHLATPNATILESFIGEGPNWTVPPDALTNETEASFELMPFGAGPFEVQSNITSSKLVLQRNPHYWAKGEPYLDGLTYLSVTGDQSANFALQSGEGQVVTGLSTAALILGDKSQFKVDEIAGAANKAITFNPAIAPFNNPMAREAIYLATNPKELLNAVAPNFGKLSESQSTSSDLFYEAKVPGYPVFNVAKAQKLVQQLGGLSFTLICNGGSTLESQICVALQSQMAAAGITMTPSPVPLASYLVSVHGKTYQALLNDTGDFDPDVGVQGLPSDFQTGGAVSGYTDPTLFGLINKTEAFVGNANRQRVFYQVYKYISDNFYSDELFSSNVAVVTAKNVEGLKVIPGPAVELNYEYVWLK